MKAVILGGSGQDGYYLRKLLESKNIETQSVSRSTGEIKIDVKDFDLIHALIKSQQPDYIFHFAAESSTKHDALFANHEAISTGTLNILEAVRTECPKSRVFVSGSAMQFINKGLPIDETTAFSHSSPYAVSRIQSVYAARYFREKFGLRVYVGYLFNHDSPLRSERHINQMIIQSVKRIASGLQSNLEIGNMDVQKEFNYAGDIVRAIWLLVNQDEVFEAVIGSGTVHSIGEWIKYCFDKVNLNFKDYLVHNSKFITEYDILVSNPKLIKSIGWKSDVSFKKLADLMWNKNIMDSKY